jgi:1-acyl-sn-glycerol-3-phosphate acyltransferase
MKRPEIKLDLSNAEEVYEYYGNRPASETFKPRLAKLCTRFFKPYIYIEQPTQDKIDNHLENNGQVACSLSHGSWLDVPNALSAFYSIHSLREILKRVATPAKAPIFNSPLLGWIVLHGDGVPYVRDKDMKKAGTYNAETIARKKSLGPKVTDITIDRADKGSHIAFFPEGERHGRTSLELLEVRGGLGKTVCESARRDNFLLVSVGIDYGEQGNQFFRPSVAITAQDELAHTPDRMTLQVKHELQAALDLAAAHNPKRSLI